VHPKLENLGEVTMDKEDGRRDGQRLDHVVDGQTRVLDGGLAQRRRQVVVLAGVVDVVEAPEDATLCVSLEIIMQIKEQIKNKITIKFNIK
jgi:hypothetical protein